MATLEELAGLNGNTDPTTDDELKAKCEKAMLVIAKEIEDEDVGTTNHAARLALAKECYQNPQSNRDRFLKAMVAANADSSLTNIITAPDSAILNAVRDAWNTFIEA